MNRMLPNLSADSIFRGKIRVNQPKSGYRFSIDSVLLANSVQTIPGDRIVDLGAGCGIISLIMAHRNPLAKVFGIEVQPLLAEIAGMNITENRMADTIEILCKDLKRIGPDLLHGSVDLVVTNPPFIKAAAGRLGSDVEQAIARHEIEASLSDVLESAFRLLKVSGKLALIYPAHRLVDLIYNLRCLKMEPKWLREVQPGTGKPANRIIVHAIKEGRPGLKLAPPLIVHRTDGTFCSEVEQMFKP